LKKITCKRCGKLLKRNEVYAMMFGKWRFEILCRECFDKAEQEEKHDKENRN